MTNFSNIAKYEQIVKEWLSEYKSLPESSLPKYAQSLKEKMEVLTAFKHLAANITTPAVLNLVQSSCHQLFDFYRRGNQDLKFYALGFLPAMINGYLLACFSRQELASESKASFETYLLAIYNLICDENGNIESSSDSPGNCMEIPNLAKPSIYHDPMTYPFSEHTITMSNTDTTYVELPTPTTYEAILPSNRCKVLNTILISYCDHLSVISKVSLQQLCMISIQLATQGFPWEQAYESADISKKCRRIQLDTNFILTLVRCIYFALYNHCKAKGIKAVEMILKRAEYELNTQVLLLCNAILNSVYQEGGTSIEDESLGVSVELTPMMVRSNSGISRFAVTASSIRHHRWRHRSEEVSGDVTESLQQESLPHNHKLHGNTAPPTQDVDDNTSSKTDKHSSISPSKLLKTKLKKNVPSPSTAGEKGNKWTNSNDKTGKKWLPSMSSFDDDNNEQSRNRNTSGNSVDGSALTSASLPSLKQLSIDDPATDDPTVKLPTSKSIDVDGQSSKNGVADSPSTSHKKSKAEKAKHKGKNSDSEIMDLLSGLRRSGSKKHKEPKSTQQSASIPLLETTEIGPDESISTVL
uniref:Hyccin n=1 Tax=Phallusia mammillata TaxID=59560 RepID=A0A6F9DD49_9ASCI|nr:hyccin [Phallusia mammillata]